MSSFLMLLLMFSVVLSVVPVSASPSGSIVINQGEYTTSRSITLSLTYKDNAADIKQVRFSNDGVNWNGWDDPTPTKTWTLTSGDGTKTVYYQVRNKENQVSPI